MYSTWMYVFINIHRREAMPGRGQKDMTPHKPKMRRIKAKHQRKRFMRAKDPVLAVFMWGVQHTVSIFYVKSKYTSK